MSEPVRSLHNARVVAARRLLDPKGRSAAGALLAEGPHVVSAALASSRHRVQELFVAESALTRDRDILRSADGAGVPIVVVSDRVAASLSDTVTSQGVIAVVESPRPSIDVLGGAQLVVVLDAVSDPGNAGTIIRTADAAGADAVVLTTGSVDPGNGKCVRASAGSIFAVPVISAVSMDDALSFCAASGLAVLATTVDGDDDLDELAGSGVLAEPTAWVFGSEARGLPPATAARATRRVRIPMRGSAESLNLAAAVAVCLFAGSRAQRTGR